MTLKPGKTSGRFKVTSCIVIILNPEFNSLCRKKKHSLSHWNPLTRPERLSRIRTCCKKNVLFGRKRFERFRVFLKLISRFKFEFRRCGFFFWRIRIFGVLKVQSHNVAVHVLVLWPVCDHAIPVRMLLCPWRFMMTCFYMYIFIRDVYQNNMKPLWKVINMYMCAYTDTFTHVHIHLHLHLHIHLHIYMYMYMCVCVRVFFFVIACCCCYRCVAVEQGEGEETNRNSHNWFPPQCPSGLLKLISFIRHSECLEESTTCCSRPVLELKMVKIHWFLWWSRESSESDRVLNHLHDSNSIFRAGRIKSENFFGRTVLTIFGMWTRIDVYLILGKDSRSSVYWKKNLPRYIWGQERDQQKFKRLPDQIMYGKKYGRKLVKPLRFEKNKNGQKKKPKLDNPDGRECSEILKNARRKLERPMEPAMPCKRMVDPSIANVIAKPKIGEEKRFITVYG